MLSSPPTSELVAGLDLRPGSEAQRYQSPSVRLNSPKQRQQAARNSMRRNGLDKNFYYVAQLTRRSCDVTIKMAATHLRRERGVCRTFKKKKGAQYGVDRSSA
ncbi:unnamed protein product [Tetraodon nigroviridis]|uniref:(spotted green pufferfish) hypothetical protein n=1 Tax=Tetraodon nigroviridis TaxID=99883 RepID=Q4SKU5_TETNG|nr:unnamed protein product [Tetraodon nigroviridis]